MSGNPRSEATYSQLLAALLDAREDAAGARFETILAIAEAGGEVSSELARELRYWQRAATAAVGEHIRTTLPGLLASLEFAATQAAVDVEEAADAWRRASDPQRPTPPRGETEGEPVARVGRRRPPEPAHVGIARETRDTRDSREVPDVSDVSDPSDLSRGPDGDRAGGRDTPAPTDLLEHRRRALVAGLLEAGDND